MGSSRVRPTLETRFHIDYDWWKRDERDLRMYLISHLAPERQELFRDAEQDEQVDWVDPETAEVRRIDALQRELQTAAQSEDFITSQTSLVDAVFRLFLANGNTPLTPVEIGEELGRPPQMILKTLAGGRVYKGIRPVAD
ncbi:MAG: hypothetical protein KJ064_12345 [Anaerolineae bacterium]|jgi:hypothetical protein|nr:MAG: hypothetical protein F9K27_05940 [Anaerolineae bacterium]MCL4877441.1 hypothetical protein [Anaerolineae bacterium]